MGNRKTGTAMTSHRRKDLKRKKQMTDEQLLASAERQAQLWVERKKYGNWK